jgi:hypothetical protein
MSTLVKIAATIVIVILFFLLNGYMAIEAKRATGAGIFGFIFLIIALTAVWKYKKKVPESTQADKENLNKTID